MPKAPRVAREASWHQGTRARCRGRRSEFFVSFCKLAEITFWRFFWFRICFLKANPKNRTESCRNKLNKNTFSLGSFKPIITQPHKVVVNLFCTSFSSGFHPGTSFCEFTPESWGLVNESMYFPLQNRDFPAIAMLAYWKKCSWIIEGKMQHQLLFFFFALCWPGFFPKLNFVRPSLAMSPHWFDVGSLRNNGDEPWNLELHRAPRIPPWVKVPPRFSDVADDCGKDTFCFCCTCAVLDCLRNLDSFVDRLWADYSSNSSWMPS